MKMKRVHLLFCLILLLSTIVSADNTNTISNTQLKKQRTVLTSFYPMYIMALNILNEIPEIKLLNMTKPQTGCLHDYQLTPQDVKNLASAEVFIVNGSGMESFLDKVIKQYSKLKIIVGSHDIELLKNNLTTHEDKKHSDHGEEVNPHVWVSISLAIRQIQYITSELTKIFPEFELKIKNNSQKYVERLNQLKQTMHNALREVKNKNIVTFHEAFPYFAQEFNLNIVTVIQREPGSEPSAKELKETIEQVKKFNVKALFAEPQYPVKAANTIAHETKSKIYYLDPAVTGPNTTDAYIKIMENNLKVLLEALN